MKLQKRVALLMVLLVAGGTGTAFAHGYYRGGVGVYFGPSWWPGFYRPPLYYSPQVIVVPAAPPPVYIEQREVAVEAASETTNYWHYCREAKGYYPYVKECPGGWQKILPQPAK